MDDDPYKPFKDARANLRDTAKWTMTGTGAIVALVIGGASISQLGSMDLSNWRLWLALGAVIVAAGLCWIPFQRAVAVLQSEAISVRKFTTSADPLVRQALAEADALLNKQLPEPSITKFSEAHEALRATANTAPEPARTTALNDMIRRQPIHMFVGQTCITQLIALRFSRLIDSLAWPGGLILVLLLVFAWAANPAREPAVTNVKPYVLTPTPSAAAAAALKSAGADQACYTPKAKVIVLGTLAGERMTGVMTSPEGKAGCPPLRVTIIGGRELALGE